MRPAAPSPRRAHRALAVTAAVAATCVVAAGCTVANSGHGRYDPNTLRIVLPQPSGCRFRTRCWRATEICATQVPPAALDPRVDGHSAECHHPLQPESAGAVPFSA
jgi:hypothetical protein